MRVFSGLMVICLLTMTVLAVPETPRFIVVSVGEIGQDIRYEYLSRNFPNKFTAAIFGLSERLSQFLNNKQSSQIQRIEILPGDDLTIRQGEPVNFSAIAYSTDGIPVSGVNFNWTIRDTGRDGVERPLLHGDFQPMQVGRFVITAKVDGFQAEADVTVEENRPLMTMRGIQRAIERGHSEYVDRLRREGLFSSSLISSRADYGDPGRDVGLGKSDDAGFETHVSESLRGPNAGSADSSTSASRSVMMRPPDEDGWDNGNWWLADDPENQTGNPPGTSPELGAGNGNFQLSAPVVALPGRGIDLALSLNYNSRVWSKSGNQMIFDAERGFPAPGWNLGFGKMMFMGTSGGCMMIDADGTQHGYTGTISNYSSGSYSSTNFTGHSVDGTFIDYHCAVTTYSGVTSMYGTARLPNGTKISYYSPSANGKQAFPTNISDANGNFISITYRNGKGPSIQTITDTLGRVVTFNYDSLDRLISVDVPKLNNAGTRTAVRIHYKQLSLNPGWASGITTDTNNWSPYVIDAIYYPGTSTGYWFNETDSYSSYGMIAKVIEQRGMSWTGTAGNQGTVTAGTMSKQAVYNYTLTPDSSLTDAPTYTTLTESWAGMDTGPAVTGYSVSMNSSPRTITVTQPNGLKSKQYMYKQPGQWNDGLIYQDETLDSSNNQLSKSVVTWAQGAYDSPRPTQTLVTDENLQTLKTTFTYGSNYNQVTSQKQYDYDGTTLLRESRSTYENNTAYTSRHIFNLVKSSEVYDGAGNRLSKTDFEYDNNAVVNGTSNHNLKATPDVIKHYSTYDPFTTETQQVPSYCLMWDPAVSSPSCDYEGQEVWTWSSGGYYALCMCTDWVYDDVSVYDPNTVFRGNLTKTTVYADASLPTPSGAISHTKEYDVTGNLVAESASCCELTTYDYTVATQYAYPTTFVRGSSNPSSPLKNTSTAVYDYYTGLIKESTDPNGLTSTTTYDAETLRPTQTTGSTGAYTTITYDESAMTIVEEVFEVPIGGPVTAGKSKKYLNGIGQVVRQDEIGPGSVTDITEVKYNELGQVWKQSNPYRSGDTIYWSEKFYDIQGRVTKVVEPDGSETKAFYNETTRPDSASNLPGSVMRVMDAWGRERWARYDALGSLVELVEPNPTGNGSVDATGSLATTYLYDPLGRLIETEQGAQTRKFKYDSLGRLTRQKLAEHTATLNDSGVFVGIGHANAKWGEAFVYDDRSNLIQKTDPRGVRTDLSYELSGGGLDPLNRIQSRSYDISGPLQSGLTVYQAPGVTYEYMTTGDQTRIKKIRTAGMLTEDFSYDGEARVSEYKQTLDYRTGYPMTINYLYDTLDRVTEVHYPEQYGLTGNPRKIVAHSYDTASRLTQMTYGGAIQASDMVFNASGQTTEIKIGAAGTNQVTEEYTFDPQTGLLTNQTATKNGTTTLLDLSYEYNRLGSIGSLNGKTGHLTKIIDNLNNAKNREYEFDALGRLTKAKGGIAAGAGGGWADWTQTYTYDRYGNRTNVSSTGSDAGGGRIEQDGITSLSFDTTNNRITTAGYEYDAAGNQIRALAPDGNWLKYEYDAANRLRIVMDDSGNPMQRFSYGSTNARAMALDYQTNRWTIYAAAGGTTLAEYTEYTLDHPTWTKSYTYLGDSQLATVTPDGSGGEYVEFNHPDRLGTKLQTNQALGTSYEQNTLPFGTALNNESTLTNNNKRFTSYDRSSKTGLDYAINRTYDSKQGRFSQVDPIGMSAASLAAPQTLNMYTYCGNDPINYTDPLGLFFGSFFRWLGRVIMSLFRSGVARRIAVRFVVSYVTSGFSLSVAIRSIAPEILTQLGLSPNPLLTPSWNPSLPYPISFGVGSLSRYIIYDFLSSARKLMRCPPSLSQLLSNPQLAKILKDLLENKSGHRTDKPLENGGWIYQYTSGKSKGKFFFQPVEEARRGPAAINLNGPPSIRDARVIAKVHTHPYRSVIQDNANREEGAGRKVNLPEGYTTSPHFPSISTGPSEGDYINAVNEQMPSIVVYEAVEFGKGTKAFIWRRGVGPARIDNVGCK